MAARGVLLVALLCIIGLTSADLYTHKYDEGEKTHLWVNKVGPFQNPQESYPYYDLPYCQPDSHEEWAESLGEALQGYELVQSDMMIPFKVDVQTKEHCTKILTAAEAETFRRAIKRNYWFQMFYDDLPIWGRVGETVEQESDKGKIPQVFVYTHRKFSIAWNGNRIIEVNLTTESPVAVEEGANLLFTFSAVWTETSVSFENRFDKYLDETFFEHQIHWFSIFNSFMMVIFLTGLVTMILMRTLRKDFANYARGDDDDAGELGDLTEDSGWKQVRGDVFRSPPHLVFFSSLLGTGYQLTLLIFCVILLAALADFYEDRGAIMTALVICYTLTSFIGGFASAGFYTRMGGKNWIQVLLLTSIMFPGFCYAVIFILNLVAVAYRSMAYIHVTTMLRLAVIWLFVACPLTFAGTILGKNWDGKPNFPCRVSQLPRQIPEKKWYLQPWLHVLMSGILPFGSIFIEMYFVFTSFWHYKYYYVYGFMLLVFVILIIVSICVTIVSTYFLLNAEDYRWYWTSFLSSASTAFYVFLYSIYYFLAKTKMTGFFQTAFYFGYMTVFCIGLGILCGAIGFWGTSVFVYKIYQMKME